MAINRHLDAFYHRVSFRHFMILYALLKTLVSVYTTMPKYREYCQILVHSTDSSFTGRTEQERLLVAVDSGSKVSGVLAAMTLTDMSQELAVTGSVGC